MITLTYIMNIRGLRCVSTLTCGLPLWLALFDNSAKTAIEIQKMLNLAKLLYFEELFDTVRELFIIERMTSDDTIYIYIS